jgi:O-antigen/teichoic acid export membrane protein
MADNRINSGNSRLRLYQGIGAQGFSQAVQIIIRLVEIPLFLSLWGTALYGEWLMVAAIPVYFSMGDGGFTGAACRQMCILSAAGDPEGALSVFQSTWTLLLVISVVVVLIALLLITVAPLTQWLGFVSISSGELQVVLLLLIAHVLIGFQGGLLYGGFWCSGRYPMGMCLMTMAQILEFVGLAVALTTGGGPVRASIGYISGRLLGIILTGSILSRVNPALRYGYSSASTKQLKKLIAPALTSLAFPVGNALNIQGIRLIVGIALGPSAVAVFTPLRTLSRFAMQPRAIVNQILEPELALAFGTKDKPVFGRIFTKSCQITLWATMATIPVLALASFILFPYWTGGQIDFHWPLYLLLLATTAANSLWYTALMVPYATNRHGPIAAKYCVIYGFGAFLLSYFLARFFGLVGVATALLIVEVAMTFMVIPAAIKMSSQRFDVWLGTITRPPLFLITDGVNALRRIQLILSKQKQ